MTNAHKTTKILNIDLVNLDTTTENTLKFFINSNLCNNTRLADFHGQGDLFILDIDRSFDNSRIFDLEQGKQYVIALYMNDYHFKENSCVFPLKKPIKVKKLIENIDKVYEKLFNYSHKKHSKKQQLKQPSKSDSKVTSDSIHNHLFRATSENKNTQSENIHLRYKAQKFVGSNKDIQKNETNLENIYLNNQKYLFHYLNKIKKLANANKENYSLLVSTTKIYYSFIEQSFIFSIDASKLKYLQSSILTSNVIITKEKEIRIPDLENKKKIEGTSFIWQSVVQVSKGRLPKNTNINSIVSLNKWPNFSRLQIFRYNIQICALWAKHKISLFETAKQLQIPQRYVFTLYCVLNTLGCAEVNDASGTSNKIEIKSNNQSLFSRILSHVFQRS